MVQFMFEMQNEQQFNNLYDKLKLQGTLYNYYYVILRNRFNGDTTSP